jgi:hypothetical protein
MAGDWTLVEYRPGRYIKISPAGAFLGKATEREVRAWFAARGGLLTVAPEPGPALEPAEPPGPASGSQPAGPDAVADEERPPEAKPPAPTVPETSEGQESKGQRKPSPSHKPEIAAPPVAARNDRVACSVAPGVEELPSASHSEGQEPKGQQKPSSSRKPEIAAPPVASGEEAVGGSPAPEAQESPASDGAGHWLWVDPRQESGYQPSSFDLEAFLQRAIALFQAKDWTRGQRPGRLAVHPEQRADGLEPAAEALGLEVVSDPLVSPGTYRLGLAELRAGDRARRKRD